MVLARIEGAPAGTRGISLFIVPKFLPDADGKPGARNALSCTGLEEKMGIHANATCFMSYEGATGWLVGEENRGLPLMFVMMNESRLGVGVQGLSQAEAAYQAAAAFARDRLQGRSLTGPKNPDGPADPILVHPDVRRMLMDARAILEGGRAFMLWTALRGDLAHRHPDEAVRQASEDVMGLMTPVLKAFLTDRGFSICSDAMQVCGGAGFTEHLSASQYLRDCRITLIYEGTNGVQALDLVGRKLAANGGRAVMALFSEIDAFVGTHGGDEAAKPFIDALAAAKAELQDATFWLMQNGPSNPDNVGARLDRLSPPIRPDRARLPVGPDGPRRQRQARRRGRRPLLDQQTHGRPPLHRPPPPPNHPPPDPRQNRRRHSNGPPGRRVLMSRQLQSSTSQRGRGTATPQTAWWRGRSRAPALILHLAEGEGDRALLLARGGEGDRPLHQLFASRREARMVPLPLLAQVEDLS